LSTEISNAIESILKLEHENMLDILILASRFYIAAYNLDLPESVTNAKVNAIVTLNSALELEPDNVMANLLLGIFLFQLGYDGQEYLEKAYSSGFVAAGFPLVINLAAVGKNDEAIEILKKTKEKGQLLYEKYELNFQEMLDVLTKEKTG